MKGVLLPIACALLMGCDYVVPLVKTPALAIDNAVMGLWQPAKTNDAEALLVLPLDTHQYLVEYHAGDKDALFAKACLCRVGGKTLVQLEWFGTAEGTLPDNKVVFQFASYSVKGDELTVRLLNADVVKKDAATSDDLAKRIVENIGNPDCFREPMVFRRQARTGQ